MGTRRRVACAEVLGNLNDPSFEIVLRQRLGGAFVADYVVLDGSEACSPGLRMVSEGGIEVDVRIADGTVGDGTGVSRGGEAGRDRPPSLIPGVAAATGAIPNATAAAGSATVPVSAGVSVGVGDVAAQAPWQTSGPAALLDGDVLGTLPAGADGCRATALVVRLRSAEVLQIEATLDDPPALARLAWEVGNMHAPLFRGNEIPGALQLLTPCNPVLERVLAGISGVRVTHAHRELDPARRFSTRIAEVMVQRAPDLKIVRRPAR